MASMFPKYNAFYDTVFSRPHERITWGMWGLNSCHHISGFDEQNHINLHIKDWYCKGQFCQSESVLSPDSPQSNPSLPVPGIIVQPLAGPKFCFECTQSCCFFCILCLWFSFSSNRALLPFSEKSLFNRLLPKTHLEILLYLTPDDLTRQRETPWGLKG